VERSGNELLTAPYASVSYCIAADPAAGFFQRSSKGDSVKTTHAPAPRGLFCTLFTLALLFCLAGSAFSQDTVTPRLPTVYLIGDSTVKVGTQGQVGWGDPIAALFDKTKVNVVNRARGGRSSKTYLTEGLWDAVLAEMKPGDFVLMQFGHNDGGGLSDPRGRASIKGNGDETQEITNKATGKTEVVHSYGWYLRKYIGDAKAKGVTAIVLSPIPRNIWRDGKVARASNDYGKWAMEAAKQGGALFIDLNELIARCYEATGQEKVAASYFGATDHTHTTLEGAKVNAEAVVEGIRGLTDCPLKNYLLPATEAGK
jgi:rhamnogalacturonan acetylesterase